MRRPSPVTLSIFGARAQSSMQLGIQLILCGGPGMVSETALLGCGV